MSFESGLLTFVNNTPAIATKLGGVLPALRFYPITYPQGVVYPSALYQRVNTSPTYSHDGDSGLDFVRYQIRCSTKTALATQQLANAFRAALSGYKGMLGDTYVGSIRFVNDIDDYDPVVQSYHRLLELVAGVNAVVPAP